MAAFMEGTFMTGRLGRMVLGLVHALGEVVKHLLCAGARAGRRLRWLLVVMIREAERLGIREWNLG